MTIPLADRSIFTLVTDLLTVAGLDGVSPYVNDETYGEEATGVDLGMFSLFDASEGEFPFVFNVGESVTLHGGYDEPDDYDFNVLFTTDNRITACQKLIEVYVTRSMSDYLNSIAEGEMEAEMARDMAAFEKLDDGYMEGPEMTDDDYAASDRAYDEMRERRR